MLSKSDLNKIRTIIQEETRTIVQEELKAALTIEIQYEKFDKDKGMKEALTKKFHLSVWLADQFPYLTGALRGMQEDTNKANNKMRNTAENVKKLTDIMIQAESSLKCISALSDKIKEVPQIEDISA